MKINLLVINALLVLTMISPTFADNSDSVYDSATAQETQAQEEGLFFDDSGSQGSIPGAFDHIIYDEETGAPSLSPLGNTDNPYSVMARIDKRMFVGGIWTVSLSDIRAAFTENQRAVEEGLSARFYAESEGMIFLDRDGVTVVSAEHASFVVIADAVGDNVNAITKIKWDECNDPAFRGNYTGYGCSRNRAMANIFRDFLAENLLSCVNQSLNKINRRSSTSVYVLHAGTAADRNHSRASYHAVERAIDIKEFTLINSRGEAYKINYKWARQNRSAWQFSFFKQFRTCWGERQLRQSQARFERSNACRHNNMIANTNAGLPYYASIGWEEPNHGKHLHLSLPHCGSRSGYKKL
jgi:hypothetical protein